MKQKFSRVSGAVLWGICVAFSASEAAASDSSKGNACPAVWVNYVSMVEEIVEPLGPNFPLVFEMRGGGVFDCLNLMRDGEKIENATALSKSDAYNVLPEFIDAPLDPSDPESWPPNVCSRGETQTSTIHFFTISLPTNVKILETKSCWERIRKSAHRLVLEHANDR